MIKKWLQKALAVILAFIRGGKEETVPQSAELAGSRKRGFFRSRKWALIYRGLRLRYRVGSIASVDGSGRAWIELKNQLGERMFVRRKVNRVYYFPN